LKGQQDKFKEIRAKVSQVVAMLNEERTGADLAEARKFLQEAADAIRMNDLDQALSLIGKAELAAKPTIQYLLDRAKNMESNGSQAYKEERFSEAIELWQKSLAEYNGAKELALERKEEDIIKALSSTIASVQQDIEMVQKRKASAEVTVIVEEESKAADQTPKPTAVGELVDVFISYVEEDANMALEIALLLEEEGYTTWCYGIDSVPGFSYLIQAGQAIERSKAFLLVVSPHSLVSHQVTQEVIQAHESNKYFFPVLSGITHTEFQNRQPEWRLAVGIATSIQILLGETVSVISRFVDGLKTVGIIPRINPDATRIEMIRKGLASRMKDKNIMTEELEAPKVAK
jgi:tetratricopeptide (TPR) repeat protein